MLRRITLVSLVLLLLAGVALPVFAQSPLNLLQNAKNETAIEATADSLEYDKNEKKIVARGNVVIVYQATKLTADYVEVFTDSKKAYAEGHVTIHREGGVLRGEKVFYNFQTHQGSFPNGTAMQAPWYGYAQQMDQVSKDKIQLYNAMLTTCPLDQGDPHYEVTAKRAILYPGSNFVAYDVKFKIFGRTVFWLPYLNIPLDIEEPPFTIQPGRSSEWGFYVKTAKTFALTKNIDLRGHFDWYEKRGFGAGLDAFYGFEQFRSNGFVKMYGIQDRDSPVNSNIESDGVDNPYSEREKRNRYRLSFKHRTDFDDYSSLIMQFHKFSDEYFLKDFFESEYRQDVQPPTYVTVNRNTERSGLFINTEFQTNDFFDTTEQLPQVRFDWNNQRVGRSKLFYTNQSGFSNFKQKKAYEDDENAAWRFDTMHKFSLPLKWQEIQMVPYAGVRETYYTNSEVGGSQNRFNVMAGIDFKTQFSKVYDWSGEVLGVEINKIRHIVEPSIGFHDTESFGPKSISDLYQFDVVDKLGDRRLMVLGLENRIQTKRNYNGELKRVDVVSMNTYLFFNAKTDQENIEEMIGFTSVKLEGQFRPYDWLMMEIDTTIDAKTFEVAENNFDLVMSYKDWVSILVGYRYIQARQNVEGSNQVVADMNFKLNSRWELGAYVRAEMAEGRIEEWELRLTRDLSCGWFLDMGFNVRDDDIETNNSVTVYARLTLVPANLSYGTGARATFSNPRIGDRVAGGASNNFSRDILGKLWHSQYQPASRFNQY